MAQKTGAKNPLQGIRVSSRDDYTAKLPVFEALREEAVYIIRQSIAESGIKIHDVESRIKKYDSISNKINQAGANASRSGIFDVIGLRVVCLFRSDITKIKTIIETEFEIISSDNKIESSDDTFGYMSVHFICQIRGDTKGRRYDAIKEQYFEIQVRTLCMHAWAAISHYLDYKSEWDIPGPLKKDLNALSALFHLADSQYENIFRERKSGMISSSATLLADHIKPETPLNLDTLFEFLSSKYPTRSIDKPAVSDLNRELNAAGFNSIDELEKELDARIAEFNESESKRKQGPFAAVGVVRISLCKSHPAYKRVYDSKSYKTTK